MVGFNRRFAPHIVKARQLLDGIAEPKCLVMTVNAGAIPLNHWTQDRDAGGGRLIGEGCHFVDLLRFLVGAPIADYEVRSIGKTGRRHFQRQVHLDAGFPGRLDRHPPLLCQWPPEPLQGAAGNLLCESRAATRQLSHHERLRMAGLSQDEPVAAGQGPARMRRRVRERRSTRCAEPDSVRGVGRSVQGLHRGGPVSRLVSILLYWHTLRHLKGDAACGTRDPGWKHCTWRRRTASVFARALPRLASILGANARSSGTASSLS